jgi:hypothetical protein
LQGSRDGRLRYEATAATSAAGFSNANRSPGWQSSTSQSFSGVPNRMALADLLRKGLKSVRRDRGVSSADGDSPKITQALFPIYVTDISAVTGCKLKGIWCVPAVSVRVRLR